MGDEIRDALQLMKSTNQRYFALLTTQLITIRAMVDCLLSFEEGKLVQAGLPADEAHQAIEDKLGSSEKDFTEEFMLQMEHSRSKNQDS